MKDWRQHEEWLRRVSAAAEKHGGLGAAIAALLKERDAAERDRDAARREAGEARAQAFAEVRAILEGREVEYGAAMALAALFKTAAAPARPDLLAALERVAEAARREAGEARGKAYRECAEIVRNSFSQTGAVEKLEGLAETHPER